MALWAKYYDFGPYRIDTSGELLLRDGEPQALPPKALDVLIYLVRHAGRTVRKQQRFSRPSLAARRWMMPM